jgi:hypothetical protein
MPQPMMNDHASMLSGKGTRSPPGDHRLTATVRGPARNPFFADQGGRHVPARGVGAVFPAAHLRAAGGDPLARHGHRLQEPAAPLELHPVGLLGGRRQRALVDPDRLAARGQRRLLVWPAGLDRAAVAAARQAA